MLAKKNIQTPSQRDILKKENNSLPQKSNLSTQKMNTAAPPSAKMLNTAAPWPSLNQKSIATPQLTPAAKNNGGLNSTGQGAANADKRADNGIFGTIKNVGHGLFKGAQGIFGGVKSIGSGIVGGVTNVAGGLYDGAKSIGSGIKSVGNGIIDGIGNVAGGLYEGVKSVGSGLYNGAQNVVNGVKDIGSGGLKSVGNGLWNGIKSVGNGIIGGVKNVGNGIIGGTKDVGNGLYGGAQGFIGGVKNVSNGLYNGVVSAGNGIVEGVPQIADGLMTARQSLWDGAKGVAGSVGNVIKGTFEDGIGTVQETWGNIKNAGSNTWANMKDAWNETFGENAKEQSTWDKLWHLGGTAAGQGAEFFMKAGTEIGAGSAKFISQGAGRIADEISPDIGDQIRSAGVNTSNTLRNVGYTIAEVGGDIVSIGYDTTKGTLENMSDAVKSSWSDMKDVWAETWGEDAEERSLWDKIWHFGGKALGEGSELLMKLGTDAGAGITQFLSQGAGRVADEFSPNIGDSIRESGQNLSDFQRMAGYKAADITGDIVYSRVDTTKWTIENMGDAFKDFGENMKKVGSDTWNDIWNEQEDGTKRTWFDIAFNLIGGTGGAASELLLKLNTDINSGNTKFMSQAAGRIVDEFSPEAGDNIRNIGEFAAEIQRMIGYKSAEIGGDMVYGALAGDSIKDPNLSQIAGMIVMGLIPVAGQIADVRDVLGAGIADDSERMFFSLLAFLPAIGDGAKHADELAVLAKNSDELMEVLKNTPELMKQLPELTDVLKNSPEIIKELPALTDIIKNSPDIIKQLPALTDVIKNTPEILDVIKNSPDLAKNIPELSTVLKNSPELAERLPEFAALTKQYPGLATAVKKPEDIVCFFKMSAKEQAAYLEIIAKEQQITSDALKIVENNGGQLAGLDYKIKSPSSIYEKLYERGNSTTIQKMNDVIRYTEIHAPDNLAEAAQKSFSQYEELGYTINKVKNTWSDGASYKGINVTMTSPDGQIFEIQYHTQQSFDLKNGDLHKLYEEARTLPAGSPEAAELEKRMKELSSQLETPKDIEEVISR